MQDKEFDEFFRTKFSTYEEQPSGAVWEAISRELGSRKRRSYRYIWSAAASVVVILAAGIWFARPAKVIKLRGQAAPQEITKTVVNQPGKVEAAKDSVQAGFFTRLAGLKINRKIHVPASAKLPRENTGTAAHVNSAAGEETTQQEVTVESLASANLSPEQPVKLNVAPVTEKLNLKEHELQSPSAGEHSGHVYASANEENENLKPAIRSVGDIVNFVVSKVDRRKDKLIEFSDSDEGSLISGINLGLVKFKAKTGKEKQN